MFCFPKWNGCFGTVHGGWENGRCEKIKNKYMIYYKRILSIAGSDPSGGAEMQVYLKTISACGCHANVFYQKYE